MKKKILFIGLLLSMFVSVVFAEESTFQFVNEFDFNVDYWEEINFTKTLKTEEGNYVVSHGAYIDLVKPSGRVVWSQELPQMTGDDRVDFYIEGENVLVTLTTNGDVVVLVYKLSNGELVNDYYAGGFFIDKIAGNYIVADWDGIYLYDEDGDQPASAEMYLYSTKSIFVEDNKVYTISCGNVSTGRSSSGCTPYLVVLNSNLEVESSKKIVGDYFNNVEAFFKVNNDFYVADFDVFKIASNGRSTMVIDNEEEEKDFLSGAKVGNYIVLGGQDKSGCEILEAAAKGPAPICNNNVLISVYDTDFNHIDDLAPLADNEDTDGIVKNITPIENGFIAKWIDWDGEFIGISEYKLKYNIETKTNGNGSVSVNKIRALDGDQIIITVEPKPGYVLGSMTITDERGNKITTTNNTFVMPASNVTVEATFLAKNPNTGDIAIYTILAIAIISGVVLLAQKKKVQFLK